MSKPPAVTPNTGRFEIKLSAHKTVEYQILSKVYLLREYGEFTGKVIEQFRLTDAEAKLFADNIISKIIIDENPN